MRTRHGPVPRDRSWSRRSPACPRARSSTARSSPSTPQGRPSFALLAPRIQGAGRTRRPVSLRRVRPAAPRGRRPRRAPRIDERRRLLREAISDDPRVQVPESFDDGAALLASTEAQGLEGVVAKRSASPLPARGAQPRLGEGAAPPDPVRTSSAAGSGVRRPGSSSRRCSSARRAAAGCSCYDGAVGSGLSVRETRALLPVLREIASATAPFHGLDEPARPGPGRGDAGSSRSWSCDVEHLGRGGRACSGSPRSSGCGPTCPTTTSFRGGGGS